MAATNEPAGQQAMTSERLAELTRKHDAAIDALWESAEDVYRDDYMDARSLWFELLAEVERLRAREAALLAVVRAVAEAIRYNVATVTAGDVDGTIVGHAYMACVSPTIQEQARALVASAGAGEQAQGEA